MSLKNS
jgi:hypothetical protein